MTCLQIHGLDAGHAGVIAVRGLDLAVQPGEIVALLGPNGAGKTTTLDTIAGIIPPIAGKVTLDGHTVRNTRDAVSHGLGYLPETRGLFRQLSVHDNLRLRTRSARAATRLLSQYPTLTPLAARPCGLLSGGEQQILALACALAAPVRVLLIDEMTMGLAPIVIKDLLAAVRHAADTGIGILLIEQHIHVALDLADRALVLRQGHVVLSGSSAELRADLGQVEESYFSTTDRSGD